MATYTIEPGDTLSGIAADLGITLDELLELNPDISNPNQIFPGDVINVTGEGGGGGGGGDDESRDIFERVEEESQLGGDTTPDADNEDAASAGEAVIGWVDAGIAEIWALEEGGWVIVQVVPGTDPPVYVYWEVATEADFEAFFGPDAEPNITMTVNRNELDMLGAINNGSTDDIANYSDDPVSTWTAEIEKNKQIYPWLQDPEMLAVHYGALIEGREPTEAEFKTTEWWQTHNEAQRAWLLIAASDPAQADRILRDNRMFVADTMQASGIANLPKQVGNYIAKQLSLGNWSETYFNQQVRALSDPYSGITIDEGVQRRFDQINRDMDRLDTTRAQEDVVERLVLEWLGPNGQGWGSWDDGKIAKWAGLLRNDPDGEARLVDALQKQRLRMFPDFDPNLGYEDIVGPVRNQVFSIWGTRPDETDPFFLRLVNTNDFEESARMLRKRGARDGNTKVLRDVQRQMLDTFGQVRSPI